MSYVRKNKMVKRPYKRVPKKNYNKLALYKAPEWKFFDNTAAGSDVGTAFVQACINFPVQGITATTRIGQNIIVQSLYIRGSITLGSVPTVATSGQQVRVLVYCDREARGATPATTDVLQTSSYISPLAVSQQGRFQVLADKSLSVDPNGNNTVPFKIFKKVAIKTKFSATAGSPADIYNNAIWIAFISNDNGGAGKSPTVDYYARVRFSDA